MSQSSYVPTVTAPPIQVLIIWPDDTYELRTIEQNVDSFQSIVGGWVDTIPTEHCVFWVDEDAPDKGCPTNHLATYLWWRFNPAMEGKDVLQGAVVVTGGPDGEHSHPVADDVIEYFEWMRGVYMKEEGRE